MRGLYYDSLLDKFVASNGWGDSKEGYSWESRVNYWKGERTMWFLGSQLLEGYAGVGSCYNIPVFINWFNHSMDKAVALTKGNTYPTQHEKEQINQLKYERNKRISYAIKNDKHDKLHTNYFPYSEGFNINSFKKEDSKMKKVFNEVLDTNKEALQIATKLSAGKTANSFFLNKLFGKFPWYARLFGKKNEFANNPLAKLASANMAKTLVTNFASDNEKLNYIADSMVQDSMVALTRDSALLDSMIKELESMIDTPDFGDKTNG